MGTITKTSNWLKSKIDGIANWLAPKPAWYKVILAGELAALGLVLVWIAQDIADIVNKVGG